MKELGNGVKRCASRERRFPLSDLRFYPKMLQMTELLPAYL
jgi:hypothetical protein